MDERRKTSPVSDGFMLRRQFLMRSLAAGLAVPGALSLLSACGGDDDDGSSAAAPSSSGAPASSAAPASSGDAAGTSAASTEKATVRYQKGPHSADDVKIVDAIAEPFRASHPNYTIENSLYDWGQMDAQLTSEFASGNPPELTYQVDIVYPKFAQAGSLLDLGDHIGATDYADEKAAYFPQFWEQATFDGKTWGVPFLNAPLALFINKDLIEAAGVSDWATSYDTLRAAAKTMTSGDTYGFSLRSTDIADVPFLDWMVYVHNAGTRILSEDKSAGALNTPEMIQTMQFLQDVYAGDKSAPEAGKYGQDGLRGLFKAGKIAIHHDQSDLALQLAAEDPGFAWEIAMVPPGPKAQTTFGNSGFVCISADAKNPDAAWEYLKFLTNKDNVVSYMTQTNFAATRKDSAAELFADNPTLNRLANEFVPLEVPFQTHPRLGEMLATTWEAVEAILRGQLEADKGMKQANDAITELANA